MEVETVDTEIKMNLVGRESQGSLIEDQTLEEMIMVREIEV